eukprot:m.97365 g.97365  ORF g.97365 m.97365 type:complete len:353 (-) comp20520_c0_seq1:1301-2359(-)
MRTYPFHVHGVSQRACKALMRTRKADLASADSGTMYISRSSTKVRTAITGVPRVLSLDVPESGVGWVFSSASPASFSGSTLLMLWSASSSASPIENPEPTCSGVAACWPGAPGDADGVAAPASGVVVVCVGTSNTSVIRLGCFFLAVILPIVSKGRLDRTSESRVVRSRSFITCVLVSTRWLGYRKPSASTSLHLNTYMTAGCFSSLPILATSRPSLHSFGERASERSASAPLPLPSSSSSSSSLRRLRSLPLYWAFGSRFPFSLYSAYRSASSLDFSLAVSFAAADFSASLAALLRYVDLAIDFHPERRLPQPASSPSPLSDPLGLVRASASAARWAGTCCRIRYFEPPAP